MSNAKYINEHCFRPGQESILVHESFPAELTRVLSLLDQPLESQQFGLQQLLPCQGLLDILVQLIQVLP